jgi:hypothetical protein
LRVVLRTVGLGLIVGVLRRLSDLVDIRRCRGSEALEQLVDAGHLAGYLRSGPIGVR